MLISGFRYWRCWRLLAMVNMIYYIHLSHLHSIMFLFLHLVCCMIMTMWKIIQSLFSSIMKELFLHFVCLHDIDEAVNSKPIVVLFNHKRIAIIKTMTPPLNSKTLKCWLLSMCSKCSIYEWYISVKKLRSVKLILKCLSQNWEDSTDFDHFISNFDIWKVIYIDFNGTGPQKNIDISVFSIYKVWYIRVYLTWK